MNDAARLAAVILRLVALGMMLYVLLAVVVQSAMLLGARGSESGDLGSLWLQTVLMGLLLVVPGVWLYRNSRELGIRLARGLE